MRANQYVRNWEATTPTAFSPSVIPSGFKDLGGIEYFDFEEDFVAKNIRCIPMIVRFKMDAVGIKLKLAEWGKFEVAERIKLVLLPAKSRSEIERYHQFLAALIYKHTGKAPSSLAIDPQPDWAEKHTIPEMMREKVMEFNWELTHNQWSALTDLQRFALLKLCRPGHENKNFPKAMMEFGLAGN